MCDLRGAEYVRATTGRFQPLELGGVNSENIERREGVRGGPNKEGVFTTPP